MTIPGGAFFGHMQSAGKRPHSRRRALSRNVHDSRHTAEISPGVQRLLGIQANKSPVSANKFRPRNFGRRCASRARSLKERVPDHTLKCQDRHRSLSPSAQHLVVKTQHSGLPEGHMSSPQRTGKSGRPRGRRTQARARRSLP